jgi:hypothetical protein
MLQEMQGQPAHLYMIANELCARRFGVEFSINLATSFTWEPDGDAVRVAVVEPNRTSPSRARSSLQRRSCRKPRIALRKSGGLLAGRRHVRMRPPDGVKPVCMTVALLSALPLEPAATPPPTCQL